jgi:hypothetical protein
MRTRNWGDCRFERITGNPEVTGLGKSGRQPVQNPRGHSLKAVFTECVNNCGYDSPSALGATTLCIWVCLCGSIKSSDCKGGPFDVMNSVEKHSHRMWAHRVMVVCGVVFALSGCKAKQQDSQAEPKTQPVAIPQAETKPLPPQEPSLGEAIPSNASEAQTRALSRYNENAWFIQEAMLVAQRAETLNAAISTLVKAGRPDWDRSHPSHQQIRGVEVSARLRPWVEALQTLDPESVQPPC